MLRQVKHVHFDSLYNFSGWYILGICPRRKKAKTRKRRKEMWRGMMKAGGDRGEGREMREGSKEGKKE